MSELTRVETVGSNVVRYLDKDGRTVVMILNALAARQPEVLQVADDLKEAPLHLED